MAKVLWILVAIVGGLTTHTLSRLYLYNPDSDLLYGLSLYRDIFERHIEISGWALTPAPYFFPDLAALFVLFSVFASPWTAYTVYIGSAVAVLCWLCFEFEKNSKEDGTKLPFKESLVAPLILLGFFGLALYQPEGVIYYMLAPTMHGGACLLSLGLLLLVAKLLTEKKNARGLLLWLGGLGFLAGLSDLICIPHIVIPILLSLRIAQVESSLSKKISKVLAFSVLGGVFAAFLLMWAGLFTIGDGGGAVQVGNISGGMGRFVGDLKHFWNLYDAFVLMAVLFLLLSAFSARKKSFLIPAIVLSMCFSVLGVFLKGDYVDVALARRMQPFFIFPFVGFIILAVDAIRAKRWLFFGAGCAVSLTLMVAHATRISVSEKALGYPSHIRCLDELAKKENLKWGLGNYWRGKQTSELSRAGLWVNQVTRDLTPYIAISNAKWFDLVPDNAYSFFIADSTDEAHYVALFPSARIAHCENFTLFLGGVKPLSGPKGRGALSP